MSEIPCPFDQKYYDEFVLPGGYRYGHPLMQDQLRWKYESVAGHCSFDSALFVGCARGFEVKYFQSRGKQCWGVDVSKHAIDTCEPEVKEHCCHYCGTLLPFTSNRMELVAAFHVMLIVDSSRRQTLIEEMCRVAKEWIVIRVVVASNQVAATAWDGVDVKLEDWRYWPDSFCKTGKFKLDRAIANHGHEFDFFFKRITP